MCRNTRWIYNRFIRRSLLVDCGHCPTCLQKKAVHRVNRIRNTYADGQLVLFCTLTYRNECVPYVWRKDFENQLNMIRVHRDSSVRYIRAGRGKSYKQRLRFVYKRVVLDKFWMYGQYTDDSLPLRDLKNYPKRVGVSFYPDLQDFYKRLRQNLKRHYNCDINFKTFSCSEYGGKTQRPHFHLLIFIPSQYREVFISAIDESWPFNDKCKCPLYIEEARDAATYVSSYVNCSSSLPKILQTDAFRQKHSYSKGFGLALVSFSLAQIRQKIVTGDLCYYSRITRDGESVVSSFPIPEYVINRYFPKFKGFSRLDIDSLLLVIRDPSNISRFREELDYSIDDELRIFVSLNNAYQRYHDLTGLSRFDYAIDFRRVWEIHSSVVLHGVFDTVTDVFEWYSFYDNINDYVNGIVHAPTLDALSELQIENYCVNPNDMRHRVVLQNRLEPLYYKLCKQKNVTNLSMSQLGFEV